MIQSLIESIKNLRSQTFKRNIQQKNNEIFYAFTYQKTKKVMKLYKFQYTIRNFKNKSV